MKCRFVSTKGKSCLANSVHSSQFCFSHEPSKKELHLAATRKGGSVGYEKDVVPLEPIDLTDPRMILFLLADTINRTRRVRSDGFMDVRVANSIGFLASKMLDAQSQILLEERISRLEESLIHNGVIK